MKKTLLSFLIAGVALADSITGGGGGPAGSFASPNFTGTPTFYTDRMSITDGSDRINLNADVWQFKTGGLNRLYMTGKSGAFPQVTTLGSDIWLEPGDEGATQGSIAFYNTGTDIGYSTYQQSELPGFRMPRHIAMSGTLFFVPPSERASYTIASTNVLQLIRGGTVAGANQTLEWKNVASHKMSSQDQSRYIEQYMGASSIFKTQQNVDMWVNDAAFVSYSSTAAKARTGTATLVGGTVTITNTTITAKTKILAFRNTPGGTLGNLSAPDASRTVGTSFVIQSDNASDTSTVDWFLIEKET